MPTALIYVCAYLDFFSSYYPRNWFCLVMPLRLFKDCVIFHHLPELQWAHWNKRPDTPFPEDKGVYVCLWRWGQLVLPLAGPQMPLFWESEKGLVSIWISQDVSFLILRLEILFECGSVWDSGSLIDLSCVTETYRVVLMGLKGVKFLYWL